MIFEGSAVALATPFTDDGVNFDTLEKLLAFHLENGSDAILILGTTGEPATMSEEEKDDVVRFTMRTVAGRVPVIVGVGGNCTRNVARSARRAADEGASAVLAVTPYYNKCSPEGLDAHFAAVAEAGGIPVIAYNVPSRTAVNITAEQYARLVERGLVAAIKEASGNIAQVADMAAAAADRGAIYSGNDDQIVPVLSLGGRGVISVLANILPRYAHDMVRSYLDGETAKATRMQLAAIPLIRALFCEVNPIPVKSALRLMGFDMGPLRLPLTPLCPEKEAVLRKEMEEFGLTGREEQ